jgi:XTP/dITP diphosphohydrolase
MPLNPSILLATENPGKIRELAAILQPLNLKLLTLADLGGRIPPPQETGEDFLANALIKAQYYAAQSGHPALADDSGLMVQALGGAPGVHSARYGGENLSDAARNRLLLQTMRAVVDRRAKFQAVLVLAFEGRRLAWSRELAGEIAETPKGREGFGYDPIFREPKSGLTLAQMTLEAKNRLSHRARAGAALRADLPKIVSFLQS